MEMFNTFKLNYHDYPKFYKKMKIFLSLSSLEGGPIPLLEAMMSNCFPVITNVGFCSDVVKNGKNGFLDPYNYKLDEVIFFDKKAFNMDDINIREIANGISHGINFQKIVIEQLEKIMNTNVQELIMKLKSISTLKEI